MKLIEFSRLSSRTVSDVLNVNAIRRHIVTRLQGSFIALQNADRTLLRRYGLNSRLFIVCNIESVERIQRLRVR